MDYLRNILKNVNCDIVFNNFTRRLYSTDASIYEILPAGIAFPKNKYELSSLIKAIDEYSIPVTARGAGSGLTGGAIGEGIVIDLSRHFKNISQPDIERRTIRVGAGVVLDTLNKFLKPCGLCFAPDVATSSRATIGGMIANNSSGARAPYYGTTDNHILSVELVTSNGDIIDLKTNAEKLKRLHETAKDLVFKNRELIRDNLPSDLVKRLPGYGLYPFLNDTENLSHLICGSEGTLALITEAELKLVPLPSKKGLGLIFFNSLKEAMQATVKLLDLKPVAIENVDSMLFNQTRGQPQFKKARDLLELDSKPCESILIVEFYDDNIDERLQILRNLNFGIRNLILTDEVLMNLVWGLRKAGLSLLTGCKGRAKPVTGIEDVTVSPSKLPEYVDALESVFKPLNLKVCYYGHAASGCLHIRPVLDLRNEEDRKIFRNITDEVAKIVKQFKGSLASEHGVGIARTEYLESQVGKELVEIMRQIKASFDPKNLFNPGKIIDDGRFKIDTNLRLGNGYEIKLPFEPVLKFRKKDESFIANLEQCNGCGGCRKETPTMCPTFLATGDEAMSTRGRANIIRAALDIRNISSPAPVGFSELSSVLASCLSCKACSTECESNVNMALLKAELLNGKHQIEGVPLQARIFGYVDILAKYASHFPKFSNLVLNLQPIRWLLLKFADITDKRPLPSFSTYTFKKWFTSRVNEEVAKPNKRVILWDDTFINYYEPEIGISAVEVLEALGYQALILRDRKCCGRPAFSQGLLKRTAKLGEHNLSLLSENKNGGAYFISKDREMFLTTTEIDAIPIIFLEPSCYSMFVEDYLELGLKNAETIAKRCYLFEEFIDNLIKENRFSAKIKPLNQSVAIHIHCHIKSRFNSEFVKRVATVATTAKVSIMDTACCGMAGAFGATESKYELSRQVGMLMAKTIQSQPMDSVIIAHGTSCRQQIEHLTGKKALHTAQLLSRAIK